MVNSSPIFRAGAFGIAGRFRESSAFTYRGGEVSLWVMENFLP